MLATVAALETINKNDPIPVNFKPDAKYGLIDRLVPSLCVPAPSAYTRLSEMLADGWTATAMVSHPVADQAILVSLVRG